MKVLLSGVSRKKGYMIIDAFYAALSAMNYPVITHRENMLKFMDVDEGFQITTLQYDFRSQKIMMG